MTDPREVLAQMAQTTGLTTATLTLITEATLPAYQVGSRLSDGEVAAVIDAVTTLVQAGRDEQCLPDMIGHYRSHWPDGWRERFWRSTVHAANLRYRHPDIYGLSPLEDEPDRLAQWASVTPKPIGYVVDVAPVPDPAPRTDSDEDPDPEPASAPPPAAAAVLPPAVAPPEPPQIPLDQSDLGPGLRHPASALTAA